MRQSAVKAHPEMSAASPGYSGSKRLKSLDALRGFDMFWIIGGGATITGLAKALDTPALNALVPQLEHVRWQGLHFWDVIWPLFMFIVGIAIPFSIERRKVAGASGRSLFLHALWRSVILFCLGMITQGNLLAWDLSVFRPCYSVLHGIAAGYLIARTKEPVAAGVVAKPIREKCRCDAALAQRIRIFVRLRDGRIEIDRARRQVYNIRLGGVTGVGH